MLELAAAVFVEKELVDGELRVAVRVKNVGAGHAIPTGEPMRQLILRVRASCGADSLPATGGHVIPDFGGAYARMSRGEDWTRWPGAEVGQMVRVISLTRDWHDYQGVTPFRAGGFTPEGRGMAVEVLVGEREIVAIEDGVARFDAPLPEGDIAYLGDPLIGPEGSTHAPAIAGAPGFGFARVAVSRSGERMPMSHRAVDIVSDNRLMPQESWTSEHRFASSCADPEVVATLSHRAYPFHLARERHWELIDTPMTEERR